MREVGVILAANLRTELAVSHTEAEEAGNRHAGYQRARVHRESFEVAFLDEVFLGECGRIKEGGVAQSEQRREYGIGSKVVYIARAEILGGDPGDGYRAWQSERLRLGSLAPGVAEPAR